MIQHHFKINIQILNFLVFKFYFKLYFKLNNLSLLICSQIKIIIMFSFTSPYNQTQHTIALSHSGVSKMVLLVITTTVVTKLR